MIQIYYGYGKGKTSASNGAALRAKGWGKKVVVIRFLKGRYTGEDSLFEKIQIPVEITHNSTKFVIQMNEEEKISTKKNLFQKMIQISKKYRNYDLVILDEIIDLCDETVGLLCVEGILEFINCFKNEIIITGHKKVKKIFELADLITFFNKEKHYFDKGVNARSAFEY